jgi:hypothetical protein
MYVDSHGSSSNFGNKQLEGVQSTLFIQELDVRSG